MIFNEEMENDVDGKEYCKYCFEYMEQPKVLFVKLIHEGGIVSIVERCDKAKEYHDHSPNMVQWVGCLYYVPLIFGSMNL